MASQNKHKPVASMPSKHKQKVFEQPLKNIYEKYDEQDPILDFFVVFMHLHVSLDIKVNHGCHKLFVVPQKHS